MDLFERGNWPGTLILIFVSSILLFVVGTLLGFFIDPSLAQGARIGIVVFWGIATVAISCILCGLRHG
jgi:threonine/homoserine/homoserine lactone efflux protein